MKRLIEELYEGLRKWEVAEKPQREAMWEVRGEAVLITLMQRSRGWVGECIVNVWRVYS